MKVLIGCERSGKIRDAFNKLGHDAMSCDTEECETPGKHYVGDVRDLFTEHFDLFICHPPCTDISVSGALHFKKKIADGRQQKGIDFFMQMVNAPFDRIGIENPVCVMSSIYRKPDQIIQPYNFGDDASKTTCLWLKNLPLLIPTKYIEPRIIEGKKRWANQTNSGQNKLGPSPDRAKKRAETYRGIADAIAFQWGIK